MSVTGEISRRAALVATNESPQRTTARKACRRGGMVSHAAGGAREGPGHLGHRGAARLVAWRLQRRHGCAAASRSPPSRPGHAPRADDALGDEQRQRQRHEPGPQLAPEARLAHAAREVRAGLHDLRAARGERAHQRRLGHGREVRLARVGVHGEGAAHRRAVHHAVEPGPLERRRDQARRARRGRQLEGHVAALLVLDAPRAGRGRRAVASPGASEAAAVPRPSTLTAWCSSGRNAPLTAKSEACGSSPPRSTSARVPSTSAGWARSNSSSTRAPGAAANARRPEARGGERLARARREAREHGMARARRISRHAALGRGSSAAAERARAHLAQERAVPEGGVRVRAEHEQHAPPAR